MASIYLVPLSVLFQFVLIFCVLTMAVISIADMIANTTPDLLKTGIDNTGSPEGGRLFYFFGDLVDFEVSLDGVNLCKLQAPL